MSYDSSDITYRPIENWPGETTKQRKPSPFKVKSLRPSLDIIKRELWYLDAKNVVFQIALRESDFRIDGQPKANARATHPGVILAFDSKYGPQQYPCDTFYDFEANVRAIALSLEALRKVDRYGVTKRGEQYTGWRAIGSGIAMPAHQMTFEEAVQLLANEGGEAVPPTGADGTWLKRAWRDAVKVVHPDYGGDTESFQRLKTAYELVLVELKRFEVTI